MLIDEVGPYRDLYESPAVVTSSSVKTRSSKVPKDRLFIKRKLTVNASYTVVSTVDLKLRELEKRAKKSPLLISGRILVTKAHIGIRNFKKAVAFLQREWDIAEKKPKKSGETMDDCILFVRQEMCKELSPKKEFIIDNDDDPDSDFDLPTEDGTDNCKTKITHNYIFPSFFFPLWYWAHLLKKVIRSMPSS